MGEWETWIKAGTGDDKTDIVVIADFWERTGGIFSRDRDISTNGFLIPFGGNDGRSSNSPGYIGTTGFRLNPQYVFRCGRTPDTRCEHAAPALGAKRGNFSIL